MRYILPLIFCVIFFPSLRAQEFDHPLAHKDIGAQKKWVDSIYSNMSIEEKVGQLFMIRAFSDPKKSNKKEVAQLINAYHIGGLIFSSGGPVAQAKQNNFSQPLWLGQLCQYFRPERLLYDALRKPTSG